VSQEFRERLEEVRSRIRSACKASGRLESKVTLIAASKTKSWEDIESFLLLGVKNFGENYVQEALKKQASAKAAGLAEIKWHLIGTLQSNKAKLIPGKFAAFHALDSFSLAQKLDKAAAEVGAPLECFLEVNVDSEETKGGLTMESTVRLLEQARTLNNIFITGLMCIPAPGDTRAAFSRLREHMERINEQDAYREPLRNLSMGMSADFESAILEGATHVRIGTTLFGERKKL
jgi:PLP dependent protein